MTSDPLSLLTEALVEANDQLTGLVSFVRHLSHSVDLHASMTSAVNEAQRLLSADAMIVEAGGVWSIGDPDQIDALRPVLSAEDQCLDDWSVLARTVEVTGGDDLRLAARRLHAFTTADRSLFEAISFVLAAGYQLHQHHQAELSEALIRQEHAIASVLAQSVLRLYEPDVPGLSVVARCKPARSAGGDFYHVDYSGGLLSLCLGDVAGKGLPAAVSMVQVATACSIAFNCLRRADPRAVMRDVDRCLYPRLDELSSFVTLVLGTYDVRSHELRLVNAGHAPVVLYRHDDWFLIPASTPPLGVLPIDPSVEHRLFLEPGDRLVIASDGLTEQMDPHDDMFGEGRLIRLAGRRTSDLSEVIDSLYDAVEEHAAGGGQDDDRTVLAIERVV